MAKTWGDVYNHHKSKGRDPSDAAFRADEWEKRQQGIKPMNEPISITGIHLLRLGDYAIVKVEIDGRWVEVIREHVDGSFSHIVEPGGIRTAMLKSSVALERLIEEVRVGKSKPFKGGEYNRTYHRHN